MIVFGIAAHHTFDNLHTENFNWIFLTLFLPQILLTMPVSK